MATKANFGQCKCCLKETYLKNMWYTKKTKGEVYGQMLVDCFGIDWLIKGNVEDDKICNDCISKLEIAVNFKNQVLQNQAAIADSNDEIIEEQVEDIVEKDEDEEIEYQNEEETDEKYIIEENIQESAEDNEEEENGEEENLLKRKKEKQFDNVEFLEEEVLDAGATEDSQDSDYEPEPEAEPAPKKPKWPKKLPRAERNRQRMQYTEEEMNTALEAVKSNEMTIVDASKTFGIPHKSISNKLYKNTDGDESSLTPETDEDKDSLLSKHRENMRSIIVASNATPIKGHWGFGYACFYCPEQFKTPSKLKQHTFEHKDIILCIKIKSLADHILKLDVTDLKCNICDTEMEALDDLMVHLKDKHQLAMHMDIPNHILPFDFSNDAIKCAKCTKNFESFKTLLEHMHDAHYRNYVCVECDRGFVNIRSLKTHSISHGLNIFACSYCLRIFYSRADMVEHEKMHSKHSSSSDRGRKDSNSGDQSGSLKVIMTDAPKTVYKCKKCPQIFENKSNLLYHINLCHKPHKCDVCNASFDFQYSLKKHIAKEHPNGRKCTECGKSFLSDLRLKEHMMEHSAVQFCCEVCNAKFVEEDDYLEHMKENHGLE